jgi:hypothetical protein
MTATAANLDRIANALLVELDSVDSRVACGRRACSRHNLRDEPAWESPAPAATAWVPCPNPSTVLDRFAFDGATVTPTHLGIIREIAGRVAESFKTPNPVHTICIEGHTDPTGNPKYNVGLGMRRAESVHRALIKALEDARPGLGALFSTRLTILERIDANVQHIWRPFGALVSSDGATVPVVGPGGDQALNRRVRVYLNWLTFPPGPPAPVPTPTPPSPGSDPEGSLAWVQNCLNRLLGARLPTNGVLTAPTRSALVSFQRGQNLPPTGLINPSTLAAVIRLCGQIRPAGLSEDQLAVLHVLSPLTGRRIAPTEVNAVRILKLICLFFSIPWRVGLVVLVREGGLRTFHSRSNHDGAMQTLLATRTEAIRVMPRALMLTLVGLPAGETIGIEDLRRRVLAEFPNRLAVQIAAGVQVLAGLFQLFSQYVTLGLIGFNGGPGAPGRVATLGRARRRPAGTSDDLWENMCRFGASLLHQPVGTTPDSVSVEPGVWKCDSNLDRVTNRGWFRKFRVRDRRLREPKAPAIGLELPSYHYLRRLTGCIRSVQPTGPCTAGVQGTEQPGSGRTLCSLDPNHGTLDMVYSPTLIPPAFRSAAGLPFPPIPDRGLPIKIQRGELVSLPAA